MPKVKSHCLSSLPGVVRPSSLQLRAVVAAHHALAHAGQIRRTFERVATALRDDAERGAADFDLAQPAGGRRHDFLRVRNVGDVGRDAAAAEARARVQPVHLHAAFVVAPARAAEHGHLRRHLDVRRAASDRDDAGNQQRRRGPRACRRDGGQHLVADGRLSSNALHVDDRRRAGHRQCFGDSANSEVGINCRVERTRELDAISLHLVESRQGERHRVGSRWQIDDTEEAALVTDGGANFLDERRARGLDGDARQCRTGGISGRSGDRCLGQRRGRKEESLLQRGERPTDTYALLGLQSGLRVTAQRQVRRDSALSLYQNS